MATEPRSPFGEDDGREGDTAEQEPRDVQTASRPSSSWWHSATRYAVSGSTWLSWGRSSAASQVSPATGGREPLLGAVAEEQESEVSPVGSTGATSGGGRVPIGPSMLGAGLERVMSMVDGSTSEAHQRYLSSPVHERTNSTLPEGLYMDEWVDPLFSDESVSLPAFLMQKTNISTGAGNERPWGWLHRWRTDKRQRVSNVYEAGVNPDEDANTPDMIRNGYHRVSVVQGGQSVPELEYLNTQKLNRAYIMRPVRMGAWLLLLLLGYVATLGWCKAGVPPHCMKTQQSSNVILQDIAQVLEMGFVTGWFARITHEKRFAWLVARENWWFYAVFFLTSPVIGLMANLPAFQHTLEDIHHWSAVQTIAVSIAVLLAVLSILWHSLQAFRRAPAVGIVFLGSRFLILAFFFTVKQMSADSKRHKFHVYPYLLVWWTSLFSEYNHVVSDATIVMGAAFLVQGVGVHSLEQGWWLLSGQG